jgi:nucleotide-binding universal stress UspA family protein
MMPSRMKIARILCPTDYSEFSERALIRAVRLARWFGASLTVVHVVPPMPWLATADAGTAYVTVPEDLLRTSREEEVKALQRFVAPYRGEGLALHTRLLDGDPSRLIQEAAVELPADLLVVGTHGRSGFEHLLLGSVTERVLRRATCPVLTVGNAAPTLFEGPLFRRIVCALDLTEGSARTLDVAVSLAEEDQARVTLVHALEGLPGPAGPLISRAPEVVRLRRELLEEAEDRLHDSVPAEAREFCSVSERVEEGKPWRVVVQVAEETGAELIVMGAHSRGAVDRAFFGSTVNHVVRQARCPVLVVREMTARQPAREKVLTTRASASLSAGGGLSQG